MNNVDICTIYHNTKTQFKLNGGKNEYRVGIS